MADTSKCQTKFCRNTTNGRTYCNTCRVKQWRKDNPFKYHYDNLRNRAKQRGKVFNLALEQFKLIWLCEPEKWKLKLDTKECMWQMDRIEEDGAYEFDNIQIISKTKNIHKYIDHRRQFQMSVTWSPTPEPEEQAPF